MEKEDPQTAYFSKRMDRQPKLPAVPDLLPIHPTSLLLTQAAWPEMRFSISFPDSLDNAYAECFA